MIDNSYDKAKPIAATSDKTCKQFATLTTVAKIIISYCFSCGPNGLHTIVKRYCNDVGYA